MLMAHIFLDNLLSLLASNINGTISITFLAVLTDTKKFFEWKAACGGGLFLAFKKLNRHIFYS